MKRGHVLLFAVAAGTGLGACAHQPLPTMEMAEVEVPSVARVQLRDVHRDIYTFEVYNVADRPIVVERDGVQLVGESGEHRRRLPGGTVSVYTVLPGGAQEIRVRFDKKGIGDKAFADFNGALMVDGKPVSVPLVPVPTGHNVAHR